MFRASSFAGKTTRAPSRADRLPIQDSSPDAEQLAMRGAEPRFAWSAIVDRKSGTLTLAVADRRGGHVIFGSGPQPETPERAGPHRSAETGDDR